MSEREALHWFLNRPYATDSNFNFRYGENGYKLLRPCQPIEDDELCLGVVGNSFLRPDKLMIRGKDEDVIKVTIERTRETCELDLPGKSAIIVLEPNICDRSVLTRIVKIDLVGEPDGHDHLYAAKVREIKNAGWIPYWAPIQLKLLIPHVRLVAKRTLETGEHPTLEDAQHLAHVLEKVS